MMTKSQLDAQIARHREQIAALCADLAACNDRAARIEKAARDVLDLYEQDKIDSLGFCERRMVAMKALTDALEAP